MSLWGLIDSQHSISITKAREICHEKYFVWFFFRVTVVLHSDTFALSNWLRNCRSLKKSQFFYAKAHNREAWSFGGKNSQGAEAIIFVRFMSKHNFIVVAPLYATVPLLNVPQRRNTYSTLLQCCTAVAICQC